MRSTELAYPIDDGWSWIYRFYEKYVYPRPRLRHLVRVYFRPNRLERFGHGRIYKLLGVSVFGKIIPTGGILIRRVTGSRMKPYTLSATSLRAAHDFFYRTCVFEGLHLPFFLAMLVLTAKRFLTGQLDLAVENFLLNLLMNVYPMMHHRNTRLRIARLLRKSGRDFRPHIVSAGPD